MLNIENAKPACTCKSGGCRCNPCTCRNCGC
jgi:hypothetical protein